MCSFDPAEMCVLVSRYNFERVEGRRTCRCSGESRLLRKSAIAVSNTTLASKFQRRKMFLLRTLVKIQYYKGSLRDREVACSDSNRQSLNLKSCVWRAVSSHSSYNPEEVLLAQLSLYVHRWPKPHLFHSFFLKGEQ